MTLPKSVGGRYELGDLLGYGGMAEVHKGKDVRLGRDVAVKVLRADLARDPSFQNRFRREAQAAAGLNHPAIVAVYDTGEDRTLTPTEEVVSPYIVMEFVEGRTLREVLKSEGQLPIRRAMEVVAEICSALDFSHRSGIVHRDVKPGNVMITRDGAVKVMDFGIARALADNAATVTATAAVIGTAQYLSPEQARGESVDARSDVYSTGCLLYELVTGHPPFTGDSPVAVAYQHVRENPRIPSTVNSAVPRELDSIIMKALAKNPLNRYQTAADMRSDLQRAIDGQRVEAETVMTDAERTQLIASPHGAPTGLARPASRAVILPAGYEPDDEPRGRRGAVIWSLVVLILLLAIAGTGYAVLKRNTNPKPVPFAMPSLVGQTAGISEDQIRKANLIVVLPHDPSNGPCTSGLAGAAAVLPPKGNVCTQTPSAGTQVKQGDPVSFTTYAGKPNVTVPQVTNLQIDVAQKTLNALELKVAPPVTVDDPTAKGTVIRQDPPDGTSVVPGSTVTLTVANGRVKLIGGLIHRDVSDAKKTLNSQGWTQIQVQLLPVTPGFKIGQVTAVDPAPGFSYEPGQQITLYVAEAVPTTSPSCVSTSTSGATTSSGAASSSPAVPPTSSPPSSPAASGAPTTAAGSGTPTC